MFTLKPEEVDFEKIESFCKEKIPEGETVEYKRAFPSDPAKLAKGISAMANTYGGIILIGVKANKTTNTPQMPITGVDLREGLEERITSICLRNINPPCVPEIKVCDFKNHKKAVIFIRVHESDQTPHAINNNTDVYLRIRSQNEPLRKATVDEIEWLMDRRKRAVEMREATLSKADERYDAISGFLGDAVRARFRRSFIIPLYCSRQLVSRYDLFGCLEKLKHFGFDRQIERMKKIVKTATEALYYSQVIEGESPSRSSVSYGEFSTLGLVLEKRSFWEDSYNNLMSSFTVGSLLQQVYKTLKLGSLFLSGIGYNGMLKIGVDVQGLRGRTIIRLDDSETGIEETIGVCEVENQFCFSDDLSAMKLRQNLDSVIVEIYRHFLFTCGFGKDRNMLETLSTKHYNLIKDCHKTQT